MSVPPVRGPVVDDETRCIHYRGPDDLIAIKFKCCRDYYPCFKCHEETAGHDAQQWSVEEAGEHAILCGQCKRELPIETYMRLGHCPDCGAQFNERCALHYPLYFEFGV